MTIPGLRKDASALDLTLADLVYAYIVAFLENEGGAKDQPTTSNTGPFDPLLIYFIHAITVTGKLVMKELRSPDDKERTLQFIEDAVQFILTWSKQHRCSLDRPDGPDPSGPGPGVKEVA